MEHFIVANIFEWILMVNGIMHNNKKCLLLSICLIIILIMYGKYIINQFRRRR